MKRTLQLDKYAADAKTWRIPARPRGIDHNPVVPNRASKSISKEDTFETDIRLADTAPVIRTLAEKLWTASRNNARGARTIVLKLKTREFSTLTRSHTPAAPPSTCDEFTGIALSPCQRVELGPQQLYRLVGVGLSNFQPDENMPSPLFEESAWSLEDRADRRIATNR